MINKEQTPAEMFRERQNTIREYRSETQLSIQLGQALNLAVEVLTSGKNDFEFHELKEMERPLNDLVDFFMSYLDKKRKEVFDQNERMYAQNPTPTVPEWEAMNKTTQAFYKDKQLANNRRSYHERKEAARQSAELDVNFDD